jgi:hypothetical protein
MRSCRLVKLAGQAAPARLDWHSKSHRFWLTNSRTGFGLGLVAAANAPRGPVDPADFKTYVFSMLFRKWISDTLEYEHAQAKWWRAQNTDCPG